MPDPTPPERLAEMDVVLDPHPDLHDVTRALRSRGRQSTVKVFGAPATLLARYEDVMAAYRDEETFSARGLLEKRHERIVFAERILFVVDARELAPP